jgi:hypothetical protein
MAYLSHVEVHFVQDKDSILRFDVPLTVYPYQFETTVLRKNVSYISIENLDLGLNFCGEGTTYSGFQAKVFCAHLNVDGHTPICQ